MGNINIKLNALRKISSAALETAFMRLYVLMSPVAQWLEHPARSFTEGRGLKFCLELRFFFRVDAISTFNIPCISNFMSFADQIAWSNEI